MAARDYARYLPAAVESVVAQTVPDWELVVVDDGSTDATPAAVAPFLADPRIRYLRSDRLGQSRAKNLGVRLTRGPLVAFLDADDIWHPTKLARQLAVFAANPAAGVVFARRSLIDPDGRPLPTPAAPPMPRGRVSAELVRRNFVCFSSAVVRREVFDRVGLFDPGLEVGIDYDLWLRAARQYEFEFVDEELVRYRTGHANLSRRHADRAATADAVLLRAVRRGLLEGVPAGAVAEGFASTARGLGYVLRRTDPAAAVRCYLRALGWGGRRWAAVRGLVGVAAETVRRFLY